MADALMTKGRGAGRRRSGPARPGSSARMKGSDVQWPNPAGRCLPAAYLIASQLFWMSAGDILRRLAADQVDHAGPEGAGADLAWHQVGTVEAEGRGVGEDLALLPQRVVGIGSLVDRLERRHETALGHPDLVRERHLQELDEFARSLRVLGDQRQRTGAEHGLPRFGLGSIGREVEEVGVLADLGAFREEGRDERRLMMQVAFRRHREEALRAVAEIGRRNRLAPPSTILSSVAILPKMSMALTTAGSLNGISFFTHLS